MGFRRWVVAMADGHATVAVEGRELMEFVDDRLTDDDVVCGHYVETETRGRHTFTMHFPRETSVERIETLLERLPPDEVERLWRLDHD